MDGWQALADEHGVFSAASATTAGLTTRELRRLVRSAEAERLDRGWFALSAALGEHEGTPWERRRRLHGLRAHAVCAAYEGRVVPSHHTALVLHELPVFAADLRQVHVTRLDGGQFRRRRGLTIHERGSGGPTDAGVIGLAASILGTARLNGVMAGLIAADAALHHRLVTREQLTVAAGGLAGPGSLTARQVAERADARAESPGETRLREALRLMSVPATAQVPIDDGAFHAVVDFEVLEHRVVIEFDGFVKYGRRSPFTLGSTPAEVVVAEKIREDHLRSLGFVVVRVTWHDLDNLPQLRHRIEAAIALARSASGGRTSGPPR